MFDQATTDFLLARSIEPEVADRCGASTANIKGLKGSSVLAFSYRRNGVENNIKYRQLPKEKFWQTKGRTPQFFNADALDDPALEAGQMPLVITEGELDCITAIQCGFPLSVSVPDGAPPANPNEIAPSGAPEQTGRFEFLYRERHRVKKIRRFILATDDDAPGRRLRDELIRHLSAASCSFVEYPLGCKDLNDVLMREGPEGIARVLNTAKQCPVRGLYKLSDFPDDGPLKVYSTGWPLLDQHFKLFTGEFIVITGIPQHGKSIFALNLLANLARLHGWRSAIFSPEMRVVPIIRDRFVDIRGGNKPDALAWIEDNFTFIGADPTGEDEDAFDLDWLLERATEAVLRDSIRVLLIDPWNELEHAKRRDESMTDYIARAIRMLKRFARERDVTVIVIAHPTKMPKRTNGTFEVPALYDISDSAAWYNKSDHGVVVHRQFDLPQTRIIIAKSKFIEAGDAGEVRMHFDRDTHRYEPLQV